MSYFNDKTDKDLSQPGKGQGMPGTDARRRSYELNEKYAGKDNEPSEDKEPKQDYSLNDDRRVKVLSPGTLVAKRFFRNRLAVVGLTILAVMFIFSFIGGLVSPYGQDEVFYRDDIQMKEYAALSENTEYRYLIADGQEFGAILQAQLTLHMGKDDSFSYKGVNYDITEEGDSLYSVSSGGTLLAVAYKDIVNPSVTGEKFSFSFSFNALKAHVTGETEFTADGKTYTMDDGSVMLNGEEVAYISRYVIQSKVSGTVISKEFKERVIEAVGKGETQIEYTNENGEVRGVVLKKCISVLDADGRFNPKYDENELMTVECKHVFFSVGQAIVWGDLLKGSKVELGRGNGAVADALTYQTAEPDIFVGGDVYTGPKFAIDAIAAGKQGAISIHRFVQPQSSLTIGRNRNDFIELDKNDIKVENYDNSSRQIPGHNDAVDTKHSFRDAKLLFTEEQVKAETARCLGCGASVVDPNKCIGCGLCTTKCEFDAIKLHRELPECSRMVPYEDRLKFVLPNMVKQSIKLKFKKK